MPDTTPPLPPSPNVIILLSSPSGLRIVFQKYTQEPDTSECSPLLAGRPFRRPAERLVINRHGKKKVSVTEVEGAELMTEGGEGREEVKAGFWTRALKGTGVEGRGGDFGR